MIDWWDSLGWDEEIQFLRISHYESALPKVLAQLFVPLSESYRLFKMVE